MPEYNVGLDSILHAFERVERTAYAAATAEYTLERQLAIYSGKYDESEYFRISEEIRAKYDAKHTELEEKRARFHRRLGL